MPIAQQRCQDMGHATKRYKQSTSHPSLTWADLVALWQEYPRDRRGVGGDGAQREAMAPGCASPGSAEEGSGSRASSSAKAAADGMLKRPADAWGICSTLRRRLLDARPHCSFD